MVSDSVVWCVCLSSTKIITDEASAPSRLLVSYPRSKSVREELALSAEDHLVLAGHADGGPPIARGADGLDVYDLSSAEWATSKKCMCLVDGDRNRWAEEHGYETMLLTLAPEHSTPRNNVIVGAPRARGLGLVAE